MAKGILTQRREPTPEPVATPEKRRRPLAWLVRVVAIGAALYLLTVAALIVDITLKTIWPVPSADADVIVVLGGPMNEDGTLGDETGARVRLAAALHRARYAPRIHMTGGSVPQPPPAAALQMREFALSLGIPPDAISVETESRSTLQNALFSRPLLGNGDAKILLVSDAYHLTRAVLTFRWAKYHVTGIRQATPFGAASLTDQTRNIAREAAAWWFNAGRLAVWHVGLMTGHLSEDDRWFLS